MGCVPSVECLGRSTLEGGGQSNPETMHDPENEVATQRLFDKFREVSIPQSSNPIAALHALEDINNQMEEKRMGRIPDTVLHARFVRTLPTEYDYAK